MGRKPTQGERESRTLRSVCHRQWLFLLLFFFFLLDRRTVFAGCQAHCTTIMAKNAFQQLKTTYENQQCGEAAQNVDQEYVEFSKGTHTIPTKVTSAFEQIDTCVDESEILADSDSVGEPILFRFEAFHKQNYKRRTQTLIVD